MTTTLVRWWPGLAALAVGVAVAVGLGRVQTAVGTLVIALALGLVVRNTGLLQPALREGINGATKGLLRLGIVLLGLQLSLPAVLGLGLTTVLAITATVSLGFLFTRWAGVRLGLSSAAATLLAAGCSICGASAVAGMQSVVDADDEDVATAVAAVTLYGSVSIVVLPLAASALGLSDQQAGLWVGLAVHEVAQVVAAAGAVGTLALSVATVVKLGRVVLLAPMAASVAWHGRQLTLSGKGHTPLVPRFVLGFLAMVALRSTGWLPSELLDAAAQAATSVLAAAMFGLGANTSLLALVRSGGRGLVVGGVSTVALTTSSLGVAVLIG